MYLRFNDFETLTISKRHNMELIPSQFTKPNWVITLRIVEETYILSSP